MKTIQLTRGKVALVDDEDYERLVQFSWQAWRGPKSDGTFYARRNVVTGRKWHTHLMHRVVLGFGPDDPEVDHWDGDGLNNQRANLRSCTRSQNQQNKRLPDRYKGVSPHGKRWRAYITDITQRTNGRGRRLHLGVFATAEEAARAYDNAAREQFGEFALLNF